MPIRFVCPGCQKTLVAPEKLAGKTVRCPSCRTTASVPTALEAPETYEFVEGDEASEASSARDRSSADGIQERPASRASVKESTKEDADEPSVSAEETEVPRRRRRRRKRRDSGNGLGETFHYYTAAFGLFPWVAAVLTMMWCCMGMVSLFVPGVPVAVIVFGVITYNVGWFWLITVAFRDDSFHGMLCLFTHFYALVYTFINLSETWKPAALMILGLFMAVSGGVLLGVSLAATHPAAEGLPPLETMWFVLAPFFVGTCVSARPGR